MINCKSSAHSELILSRSIFFKAQVFYVLQRNALPTFFLKQQCNNFEFNFGRHKLAASTHTKIYGTCNTTYLFKNNPVYENPP